MADYRVLLWTKMRLVGLLRWLPVPTWKIAAWKADRSGGNTSGKTESFSPSIFCRFGLSNMWTGSKFNMCFMATSSEMVLRETSISSPGLQMTVAA
jgi:hypothetical protein